MVTPEIQEVLDRMRPELPVVFAREAVTSLFGNLITSRRMRDLDSKGKGPKSGRVQLNKKKVGYMRDDFLAWLGPQLSSKDVEC